MATTKTARNTKASTKTTKAPAAKVAPPSLTEALKAAGSRAYQNDHVRTAGKVAIGAAIGVVLTKTVFA